MAIEDRTEGPLKATPKETGLTLGQTPPNTAPFPPNYSEWSVPNYKTFTATYQQTSRSYRYTFDEAVRRSRQQALYMARDWLIWACIQARQLPTCQFPWHIEPQDEGDNAQVEAAEHIKKIIEDMQGFQQMRLKLLDSIFFGRAAVQVNYKNKMINGRMSVVPIAFRQIHGDKIVFKWDGETIGVRVNLMYYQGPVEYTELGPAHFFTPIERETVILCQFQPTDSDYFEPELAGSIEGLGLRGRLYWCWYLRQQILGLYYNYLERAAQGTWLAYYDLGNPASYEQMRTALQEQAGSQVLLIPRSTDAPNVPTIDIKEPSGTAANLFLNEVERLDDQIQFAILGQRLVQDTAPTGLGSGVAEAQENTFDRYLRSDAEMLQDALNSDFISVLYRYNFPNIPVGKLMFDIDKPNVGELMEGAQAIFSMGGSVDANWLMSIIGMPTPSPDHPVLTQAQTVNPTMVGATPQGTPMVGDPNAAGQQQQMSPQDQQAMQQQMLQQQAQEQATNKVPGVSGKKQMSRNGHGKAKPVAPVATNGYTTRRRLSADPYKTHRRL